IDFDDLRQIEKLFAPEMAAFDRGPAKLLRTGSPQQYNQQKYFRLKELLDDKEKLVGAISRHFMGERCFRMVVVFDNVDIRTRSLRYVSGTAPYSVRSSVETYPLSMISSGASSAS